MPTVNVRYMVRTAVLASSPMRTSPFSMTPTGQWSRSGQRETAIRSIRPHPPPLGLISIPSRASSASVAFTATVPGGC